jgi:hypothetical protein
LHSIKAEQRALAQKLATSSTGAERFEVLRQGAKKF